MRLDLQLDLNEFSFFFFFHRVIVHPLKTRKVFLFFRFVRSLIEIPVRKDRTRIEKSFGTFDDVGYRFLGRFTIAMYRTLLYFYIFEHGRNSLKNCFVHGENISRNGCRNGCESCVAKGGIR